MSAHPTRVADVLNSRFCVDHPIDAAERIEQLDIADVVDAAKRQPVRVLTPVWRRLLPDTAARLLRAAHASAADAGVEVMYCHVERDNIPARRLYEGEGYVAEAEESDWLAEKLGRPARVLLRKALAGRGMVLDSDRQARVP